MLLSMLPSSRDHRYQVKAHRSRTLTTLWGDVTFTRTYYQDKTDASYHYLLDEWLGLDKSTHIEPFCRARLVARSADVSYRKAVALTTPASLSGQSVLRSIRKLGTIPNQAAGMPEPKPEIHKVYVEADEDHVAMQKSHAKEMKLINVYETKVPVCQGRRKLCGRRTFSGWEAPSRLWPEVNQYIQQVYGTEQTPEVVIKGDAAQWIKSGTEYIGNSTHVIDGYHASQYLRKIAGKGTSTALYSALRANDREAFMEEVQRKLRKSPKREKAIRDGYQYVMTNWDGIHRALTQPDAASSTEGHVSHMLSDRLSSRCMGWSPIGAEQMARMRTYIVNSGNLEAYAQKQFTTHRQTMNPAVNQEILKKEWSRRKLPYCTYIPDKAAHMPGCESTLTGGWMRLIENGGYQHIM